LDNGRSALRGSQLEEVLLCIRCGACLNVCPVFREIGGHAYIGKHGQYGIYPGPIGSVIAPGLFGVAEFGQLARASSLCGACKETCPVDIDLPKLLLRVRAGGLQIETRRTPKNVPAYLDAGLRMFSFMATRKPIFGYAQRAAGFFSRLAFPKSDWLPMPAFTGWGLSKDFPRPVVRPFSQRWAAGQVRNIAVNHVTPPSALSPTTSPAPETSTVNLKLTNLDRFATELDALGGKVIPCQSEELAGRVCQVLKQLELAEIQAWEPERLPTGLLDQLSRSGMKVTYACDPQVKAGLTGALAGIAASGTVLIPSGPGRPLTASLTPEIHLVILNEKDIYPTLSQALAREEIKTNSVTVLVTGPSRTADIEMALTIGVHGPGKIYVFCLI
jgi:L-lactate utilization protein LutB